MNGLRKNKRFSDKSAPGTGLESVHRPRGGFTLIEVVMVVAVIMVLAAILVPIGTRVRAAAQSASCVSQLRQIGVGLQLYMTEQGGRFPELAPGPTEADTAGRPALNTVLLEYVGGTPEVFACPADNSVYPETGSSYQWNSLLNGLRIEEVEDSLRKLGLSVDQSQIPVVFDAESFHSGTADPVNFLFADGSVDQSGRFYVE